jgi:hypothetical protein
MSVLTLLACMCLNQQCANMMMALICEVTLLLVCLLISQAAPATLQGLLAEDSCRWPADEYVHLHKKYTACRSCAVHLMMPPAWRTR